MRKLVWGGTVACLVTGALGTYLALSSRHAAPNPMGTAEEQEGPAAVFTPIPLAEPVPFTDGDADGSADAEAIEPIVVEGAEAPATPPAAPESEALTTAAVPPVQPLSRPDEVPGQEKKMPYAEDANVCTIPGAQLWEALCRVLTGEPAPATTEEQTEPPAAMPDKPEAVQAPLPVMPMNYHQHEQCCPYTGRCAMPYHPAPPR